MQKDKLETVSPTIGNTMLAVRSLSVKDLRVGNYLTKDGVMVQVDARSLFDIWEETKEYEPIPLTEQNILKLRRNQSEDFKPIEFSSTPPRERQVENNFWSNWINDDYRFHLSPNYNFDWFENGTRVKRSIPDFWFCWYQSQGQWFLPVKNIRGKNQLKYIHQLQNLFYNLSGYDLVFRNSD